MKVIGYIITTVLALTVSVVLAQAEPNDPYFGSTGSWEQEFDDQWALKNLRVYTDIARTAQPNQDDAQPVIVAVIDTGMDYLHNDFAAEQLWRNPQEKRNGRDDDDNGFIDDLIGWNFVDGNNNPWDRSGHGTHISGIIAACTDNGLGITAVNADAVIMPLKVANFIGQARSSAVAAAIYYAVDNGARVINLSLGGELITELERTAARYAADNSVLIVVSAGNRGLSAAYLGYASLPDVLVVGASDLNGERAGFSNFGSPVALLAPGVEVLSLRARDSDFIALSNPPDYPPGSAIVGDEEEYYRASGTSFSAAFVSGVASRLFTLRPELSASQAHRMLMQSAVDIGASGVDQTSGYGRVDFVRALAASPDTFVDARLLGVDLELSEQKILLNVQGTATADQFTSAELTVRATAGSVPVIEPEARSRKSRKRQKKQPVADKPSPYDWQPLVAALTTPVEQGVLGTVDMDSLVTMTGGSTSWELRLLVSSNDGSTRESRMSMALPVPPPLTDTAPDEESDGE